MRRRLPRVPRLCLVSVLLCWLTGCTALSHGFLNAQGPVAGHERQLFVDVSLVLMFVAGPVLLLVPMFAWHYRLSNTGKTYRPKWEFSWPVEALIWLPPAGIVIGLAILLWNWTHVDDPYRRLPCGPAVEVQAIALDWKWLFIYPDEGVAVVNRLVVPAGRPVHIRLTSGTVMQSMLIPQLAGQIYAMAGMTTELNIATRRPGQFLGENSQYNGAGFQHQKFEVVALPAVGYDRWFSRARQGPRMLDETMMRRLSARSIVPQSIVFAHVTPHLFERVVTASGNTAHSHSEADR